MINSSAVKNLKSKNKNFIRKFYILSLLNEKKYNLAEFQSFLDVLFENDKLLKENVLLEKFNKTSRKKIKNYLNFILKNYKKNKIILEETKNNENSLKDVLNYFFLNEHSLLPEIDDLLVEANNQDEDPEDDFGDFDLSDEELDEYEESEDDFGDFNLFDEELDEDEYEEPVEDEPVDDLNILNLEPVDDFYDLEEKIPESEKIPFKNRYDQGLIELYNYIVNLTEKNEDQIKLENVAKFKWRSLSDNIRVNYNNRDEFIINFLIENNFLFVPFELKWNSSDANKKELAEAKELFNLLDEDKKEIQLEIEHEARKKWQEEIIKSNFFEKFYIGKYKSIDNYIIESIIKNLSKIRKDPNIPEYPEGYEVEEKTRKEKTKAEDILKLTDIQKELRMLAEESWDYFTESDKAEWNKDRENYVLNYIEENSSPIKLANLTHLSQSIDADIPRIVDNIRILNSKYEKDINEVIEEIDKEKLKTLSEEELKKIIEEKLGVFNEDQLIDVQLQKALELTLDEFFKPTKILQLDEKGNKKLIEIEAKLNTQEARRKYKNDKVLNDLLKAKKAKIRKHIEVNEHHSAIYNGITSGIKTKRGKLAFILLELIKYYGFTQIKPSDIATQFQKQSVMSLMFSGRLNEKQIKEYLSGEMSKEEKRDIDEELQDYEETQKGIFGKGYKATEVEKNERKEENVRKIQNSIMKTLSLNEYKRVRNSLTRKKVLDIIDRRLIRSFEIIFGIDEDVNYDLDSPRINLININEPMYCLYSILLDVSGDTTKAGTKNDIINVRAAQLSFLREALKIGYNLEELKDLFDYKKINKEYNEKKLFSLNRETYEYTSYEVNIESKETQKLEVDIIENIKRKYLSELTFSNEALNACLKAVFSILEDKRNLYIENLRSIKDRGLSRLYKDYYTTAIGILNNIEFKDLEIELQREITKWILENDENLYHSEYGNISLENLSINPTEKFDGKVKVIDSSLNIRKINFTELLNKDGSEPAWKEKINLFYPDLLKFDEYSLEQIDRFRSEMEGINIVMPYFSLSDIIEKTGDENITDIKEIFYLLVSKNVFTFMFLSAEELKKWQGLHRKYTAENGINSESFINDYLAKIELERNRKNRTGYSYSLDFLETKNEFNSHVIELINTSEEFEGIRSSGVEEELEPEIGIAQAAEEIEAERKEEEEVLRVENEEDLQDFINSETLETEYENFFGDKVSVEEQQYADMRTIEKALSVLKRTTGNAADRERYKENRRKFLEVNDEVSNEIISWMAFSSYSKSKKNEIFREIKKVGIENIQDPAIREFFLSDRNIESFSEYFKREDPEEQETWATLASMAGETTSGIRDRMTKKLFYGWFFALNDDTRAIAEEAVVYKWLDTFIYLALGNAIEEEDLIRYTSPGISPEEKRALQVSFYKAREEELEYLMSVRSTLSTDIFKLFSRRVIETDVYGSSEVTNQNELMKKGISDIKFFIRQNKKREVYYLNEKVTLLGEPKGKDFFKEGVLVKTYDGKIKKVNILKITDLKGSSKFVEKYRAGLFLASILSEISSFKFFYNYITYAFYKEYVYTYLENKLVYLISKYFQSEKYKHLKIGLHKSTEEPIESRTSIGNIHKTSKPIISSLMNFIMRRSGNTASSAVGKEPKKRLSALDKYEIEIAKIDPSKENPDLYRTIYDKDPISIPRGRDDYGEDFTSARFTKGFNNLKKQIEKANSNRAYLEGYDEIKLSDADIFNIIKDLSSDDSELNDLYYDSLVMNEEHLEEFLKYLNRLDTKSLINTLNKSLFISNRYNNFYDYYLQATEQGFEDVKIPDSLISSIDKDEEGNIVFNEYGLTIFKEEKKENKLTNANFIMAKDQLELLEKLGTIDEVDASELRRRTVSRGFGFDAGYYTRSEEKAMFEFNSKLKPREIQAWIIKEIEAGNKVIYRNIPVEVLELKSEFVKIKIEYEYDSYEDLIVEDFINFCKDELNSNPENLSTEKIDEYIDAIETKLSGDEYEKYFYFIVDYKKNVGSKEEKIKYLELLIKTSNENKIESLDDVDWKDRYKKQDYIISVSIYEVFPKKTAESLSSFWNTRLKQDISKRKVSPRRKTNKRRTAAKKEEVILNNWVLSPNFSHLIYNNNLYVIIRGEGNHDITEKITLLEWNKDKEEENFIVVDKSDPGIKQINLNTQRLLNVISGCIFIKKNSLNRDLNEISYFNIYDVRDDLNITDIINGDTDSLSIKYYTFKINTESRSFDEVEEVASYRDIIEKFFYLKEQEQINKLNPTQTMIYNLVKEQDKTSEY